MLVPDPFCHTPNGYLHDRCWDPATTTAVGFSEPNGTVGAYPIVTMHGESMNLQFPEPSMP